MNARSRLLVVLVAVAVSASFVVGAGAFTSVSAERTATVDVVGDGESVLRLEPSTGPNGQYASLEGGTLAIDLSGNRGVGADAATRIDDVFVISNHGSQPVMVWIEDREGPFEPEEDNVVLYRGTPDSPGAIPEGLTTEDLAEGWPKEYLAALRLGSPDDAVTVEPGQSISIGMAINTFTHTRGDPTRVLESIVVHAVAADRQEPPEPPAPPDGPQDVSITELNDDPGAYIGETVRVRGTIHRNVLFGGEVDNSVLVTDYRRVAQNRPLSANGTLPLLVSGIDFEERTGWEEGYRFEMVGVVEPGDRETEETAQVRLAVSEYEILGPDELLERFVSPQLIDPILPVELKFDLNQCRFAVIVSGGIDAGNNHPRYWNDVEYTYRAMNGTFGLPDDQIFVHYYQGPSTGHATTVDGRTIVDGNASEVAVASTFDAIGDRLEEGCLFESEVMLFATNHGTDSDPEGLNLLGWSGDDAELTPVELRALFAQLNEAGLDEAYVNMMQCFSGQFLDARSDQPNVDLMQANGVSSPVVTAVSTASLNDQLSWGTTSPNGGYEPFGFHFVAALAGQYPDGTAVAVSAVDLNNDGEVSWYEAHQYAVANDQFGPNGQGLEDPQFAGGQTEGPGY